MECYFIVLVFKIIDLNELLFFKYEVSSKIKFLNLKLSYFMVYTHQIKPFRVQKHV